MVIRNSTSRYSPFEEEDDEEEDDEEEEDDDEEEENENDQDFPSNSPSIFTSSDFPTISGFKVLRTRQIYKAVGKLSD
jgi:hypothetical protein